MALTQLAGGKFRLRSVCRKGNEHSFSHETTNKKKKNKLRDLSSQTNYTNRAPPLVGEVSASFCG
jgi:hypothetical protein